MTENAQVDPRELLRQALPMLKDYRKMNFFRFIRNQYTRVVSEEDIVSLIVAIEKALEVEDDEG